jgi:hypothetical protein
LQGISWMCIAHVKGAVHECSCGKNCRCIRSIIRR